MYMVDQYRRYFSIPPLLYALLPHPLRVCLSCPETSRYP